jgi:hypothetical protein
MKRIACIGLGLCLVAGPAVLGQEDTGAQQPAELTDPIEILKKVDAAAKAVDVARYHVKSDVEGSFAGVLPKVDADVIHKGAGRIPKNYSIKGKIQMPGSDEWQEIATGRSKTDFYYTDMNRKVVHQDILPTVVGRLGGWVRDRALMIEFTYGEPFSDEINAEKAELIGTETVDGIECFHIEVHYRGAGGQVAHWYFSKKDFLPRRVDRISPAQGGARNVMRMFVTKLEVNPQISDEVFAAVVPEGFNVTKKTLRSPR